MESIQNNHGSAAVATTTAAQPPSAAGAKAATGVPDIFMTDAMVQQISAALSQRAVLVAKTTGAMHLPIPDTPSPPPARRRMEDTAEDVRRDLMGIIEKLQKKVDGITVDSMLFQTDIVKRLDENKTFTFKTA